MYRFAAFARRSLLECTLSGFLSIEEVADYARDEAAEVAAQGWRSGEFDMLVDLSEVAPLSQTVVSAFQDHIGSSPLMPRKTAILTGRMLVKMQLRRIVDMDVVRVFDKREAAVSWLLQG